jgi:hypothetical protein
VLEGGFFKKVFESTPGGEEGMYVYLAERSNSVMFAEDEIAMYEAGINTVRPRDFDSQDDPARVFVQLTAGSYPRNIYDITGDIELIGCFLGFFAGVIHARTPKKLFVVPMRTFLPASRFSTVWSLEVSMGRAIFF